MAQNGRTLLSQWIQRPPDASPEVVEPEKKLEPPVKVETNKSSSTPATIARKESVKQWNSIFNITRKNTFMAKMKASPAALAKLLPPPPIKYTPVPLAPAPYDVEHVRQKESEPDSKKRVKIQLNYRSKVKLAETASLSTNFPLPASSSSPIRKPQRLLVSRHEIETLLATLKTEIPKGYLDMYTARKPFDLGSSEQQTWYQKYEPDASYHFNSKQCLGIAEWIRSHNETFNSSRVSMTEDGYEYSNVLVVDGPINAGKTSAVYCAAKHVNTYVFEVSCAVKRTGKALTQLLEGISQNHAVHNAANVAILIDDVDIVYENEANQFWPILSKFAASSQRPVILTCSSATKAAAALSLVRPDIMRLNSPDSKAVTDLAWSTALSEGHFLNYNNLSRLVRDMNNDLRQVLTYLQFWCQMGLGGEPCGIDWVPKAHEMVDHDRILSHETWFPMIESESESESLIDFSNNNNTSSGQSSSILNLFKQTESPLEVAERQSIQDLCQRTTPHTETRAPPEDTIWTPDGLVLSSYYNTTFAAPVGQPSTNMDINPYKRIMAAADYCRYQNVNNEIANSQTSSRRLVMRMLAAVGVDTRQYLRLHIDELLNILKAGFSAEYL